MMGIILKVAEPKRSQTGNGMYQWVFFRELATGKGLRLCLPHNSSAFRNWDGALRPGNVLDDLNVIEKGRERFVDANSHPRLVTTINLHTHSSDFGI